jgi:hypothetical protein
MDCEQGTKVMLKLLAAGHYKLQLIKNDIQQAAASSGCDVTTNPYNK